MGQIHASPPRDPHRLFLGVGGFVGARDDRLLDFETSDKVFYRDNRFRKKQPTRDRAAMQKKTPQRFMCGSNVGARQVAPISPAELVAILLCYSCASGSNDGAPLDLSGACRCLFVGGR